MEQNESLIQKLILELAIAAGMHKQERSQVYGKETLVLICERLMEEFKKE